MDPTKPNARSLNDPPADEEPDTEGHFLPNLEVNRHLVQQRERDVRRDLERHQREVEARRPHRKEK